MYHRVRDSKYRLEIVTFIWDFLDHINPGDTILGTPTTEVIVSSGEDADPSEMILGPAIVTNGTVVSQRIRKGIPGVIYTITITIQTVQGDTFEDLAYLAILPLPPFFFNYFLETQLYPIEMFYESLNTYITLLEGRLFEGINMTMEGISCTITLTSGVLFGTPVNYNMTVFDPTNGDEAITSDITLITGVLIGGGITYNMVVGEGILGYITLLNGTLFGDPLNIDMKTEGVVSFITLTSGTLV